jgi:hypothetical protein
MSAELASQAMTQLRTTREACDAALRDLDTCRHEHAEVYMQLAAVQEQSRAAQVLCCAGSGALSSAHAGLQRA